LLIESSLALLFGQTIRSVYRHRNYKLGSFTKPHPESTRSESLSGGLTVVETRRSALLYVKYPYYLEHPPSYTGTPPYPKMCLNGNLKPSGLSTDLLFCK